MPLKKMRKENCYSIFTFSGTSSTEYDDLKKNRPKFEEIKCTLNKL
jgi:hypothetical protein